MCLKRRDSTSSSPAQGSLIWPENPHGNPAEAPLDFWQTLCSNLHPIALAPTLRRPELKFTASVICVKFQAFHP